jgi:N-methylhydantoinase A
MEQAIRLISVERGYDPHDFALLCFGGAGGLHAASLAQGLGIPRVVVPQYPGALSALGLLLADARKDYSRTLLIDAMEASRRLNAAFEDLHRLGAAEMKDEGFKPRDVRTADYIDLRYRGQSYELTIPFTPRFIEEFHKTHERRYGYANANKPVEVVNARSTFMGRVEKPELQRSSRTRGKPNPIETASVWIGGKKMRTAIYDRDVLRYGHEIKGPAIIGEYSSTTLVPPEFICRVDAFSNLVLEPR